MKTPEQIQAEERKKAAKKFCDDMLALLRKRMFQDVPEKLWFAHESHIVRQAILEPSRYMKEREAALPASRYRQIILQVVIGIEEHANRAEIRRMSHYLLHSVQRHMQLQGDRYYEEGKTPRGMSLMLDPALKAMRPKIEARDITETLAATAAALRQNTGRKRKQQAARGIQSELF